MNFKEINETIYSSTKLEISLDKIAHNFKVFRQFIPESTEIMAMVKASAYGNGAEEIAKFIEKKSLASYLAVAYVEEGVALRKAGITLPIMVLNPNRKNFLLMIQNKLAPELHEIQQFKEFEIALRDSEWDGINYPVHLKVNSGMNRLGIDEEDVASIIQLIEGKRNWEIQSIFTHLSASGTPSEDEFTLEQLSLFAKIWQQLKSHLNENCWLHALNSSGIFRFPEYHFQMVRLGIGMYGASSLPALKDKIKGICQFKTQISQLRKVKKGTTIGYGRKGLAEKDTTIATLAVGYADGFSRSLGNGNWEVEINGKLYPTIGNICMDLCMVDLGKDEIENGTEVILFGGQKDILQYAKALDTISYEAMCRIGPRVKRIFK